MDIVKEVSELVRAECFKEINPYGSSNSWRHMNHVAVTAVILARDTGADKEIVELAAWLHDWSAIQGFYKEHHALGAKAAGVILQSFDYPVEKIERIQHCVYTHR